MKVVKSPKVIAEEKHLENLAKVGESQRKTEIKLLNQSKVPHVTVKLRQFYKNYCCNKYVDETLRIKKPFRDRLGGVTFIRQGSLATCLTLSKLLTEDSEACIYKGCFVDSNQPYAVKVPN